jgi:hypothetical protein
MLTNVIFQIVLSGGAVVLLGLLVAMVMTRGRNAFDDEEALEEEAFSDQRQSTNFWFDTMVVFFAICQVCLPRPHFSRVRVKLVPDSETPEFREDKIALTSEIN